MRKIYGIGQGVTQVMLIVGIVALVVTALFLRGGSYVYAAWLGAVGVAFMVLAFALALLVHLGEDTCRIRELMESQVDCANEIVGDDDIVE